MNRTNGDINDRKVERIRLFASVRGWALCVEKVVLENSQISVHEGGISLVRSSR